MTAHRKPPDQRQDNRDQRSKLTLVEEHPLVEVITPAPDDSWPEPLKDAWTTFWTSDLAHVIERVDHPAIRRLFDMRLLQQQCIADYELEPFITGSQGQAVKNPRGEMAMSLESSIRALEDRLGLTPKARANLGIAIGQARMTAAELNERARKVEHHEAIDVELADEWEATE